MSCPPQNSQIKMVSMEEYLAMQTKKSIMMNKQYVGSLKKALEQINKLMAEKDKDRLDYALILLSIITLMSNSCQGWGKWCNVVKLNEIFETKEDFAKVADKMLKLMEKWIQIDIDTTGKQIKTMETKTTKKPHKKSRKSKSKKTSYVA